MPENVYQKYSIRSEHSLFVELKGNKTGKTTLWIEDKSWFILYFMGEWLENLINLPKPQTTLFPKGTFPRLNYVIWMKIVIN
jgi:hypothetical protein